METVFFVERFATDSLLHAEGKDLHSKLKYKHDLKKENAALRPITAEVKRLITPGMGSLEIVHDSATYFLKGEPEPTGDFNARLKLSLADDENATMRVWRVQPVKPYELEPVKVQGVFFTTAMMVILFSCRNNRLHIIYSWEGCDAPAGARAATSLRVKSLGQDLGLEGAQHQIYVTQNGEPPLLVSMFLQRKLPFIVMNEDAAPREDGYDLASGYVRCFQLHERGNGTCRANETDLSALQVSGLSASDCYIFVRHQGKDPEKSFEDSEMGSLLAIDTSAVLVYIGSSVSESQRTFIECHVNTDGILFTSLCGQNAINVQDISNRENVLSLLGLPLVPTTPMPAPTRPMRLFEVSESRRSVGGMFCQEVGAGSFAQTDLSVRGTYVLDGGSDRLWVWFGSGELTGDECELVIRVAIRYSRNISELMYYKLTPEEEKSKVQLQYAAKAAAAESESGTTNKPPPKMRSVAKGGGGLRAICECPNISILLCDSGKEDADFKSCFFGWKETPPRPVGYASAYQQFFLDNLDAPASEDEAERPEEQVQEKKEEPATKKKYFTTAKKASGRTLTLEQRLGTGRTTTGKRGSVHIAASQELVINQNDHKLDDVLSEISAGELNWLGYKYVDKKQLDLLGKGNGGLVEAVASFDEGVICYALVRFEAADLQSFGFTSCESYKIVLLVWMPPGCSPFLYGAVNSHRTAIADVFAPIMRIEATNKRDLEEKAVIEKLKGVELRF